MCRPPFSLPVTSRDVLVCVVDVLLLVVRASIAHTVSSLVKVCRAWLSIWENPQTFNLESAPHDTTRRESDRAANERTHVAWACTTCWTNTGVGRELSQRQTMPSSLADTIKFPSGVTATDRTGASCWINRWCLSPNTSTKPSCRPTTKDFCLQEKSPHKAIELVALDHRSTTSPACVGSLVDLGVDNPVATRAIVPSKQGTAKRTSPTPEALGGIMRKQVPVAFPTRNS
mmetsp:Transcript_13365/g.27651  ORF Transcript_13365/g.27651 Transcript_13365/m.27651 type:complete len:230 (-) Transcript_13365:177-866(-)